MVKLAVAGLRPWRQGAPQQVRDIMQTAHVESFIRREKGEGERGCRTVCGKRKTEREREKEREKRENGQGAAF